MSWVKPEYSKTQVDDAGRLLTTNVINTVEMEDALVVVNNWRAAHSFPLNTFQIWLRNHATDVYEHALVAQRLKRVPSIIQKLQRFPNMNLSRMQDIGGCRAVVETVPQVRKLRLAYKNSSLKHELVGEKDYIEQPKTSGYRGIHLVYRYSSDKNTIYNGRLIEIQLRSRLQHAWATAVETVGTFLQQSLKSSEGPKQWLHFFTLTGSAFALMEHTSPVSDTPADESVLRKEIAKLASHLEVHKKLGAYGQTLKIAEETEKTGAHYFLLLLLPMEGKLTVYSYRKNELSQATSHYLEIEKSQANNPGAQSVLVAADSLSALRRSYPNYFLDTQVFMSSLRKVING